MFSVSCEAKRKRKLRQETKQRVDEKKLKNKLRVKRHREKKIKISRKILHMRVFFLVTQMFFATEWKNQQHLRN